jgi:hypothetical protein
MPEKAYLPGPDRYPYFLQLLPVRGDYNLTFAGYPFDACAWDYITAGEQAK